MSKPETEFAKKIEKILEGFIAEKKAKRGKTDDEILKHHDSTNTVWDLCRALCLMLPVDEQASAQEYVEWVYKIYDHN